MRQTLMGLTANPHSQSALLARTLSLMKKSDVDERGLTGAERRIANDAFAEYNTFSEQLRKTTTKEIASVNQVRLHQYRNEVRVPAPFPPSLRPFLPQSHTPTLAASTAVADLEASGRTVETVASPNPAVGCPELFSAFRFPT